MTQQKDTGSPPDAAHNRQDKKDKEWQKINETST